MFDPTKHSLQNSGVFFSVQFLRCYDLLPTEQAVGHPVGVYPNFHGCAPSTLEVIIRISLFTMTNSLNTAYVSQLQTRNNCLRCAFVALKLEHAKSTSKLRVNTPHAYCTVSHFLSLSLSSSLLLPLSSVCSTSVMCKYIFCKVAEKKKKSVIA
uniref:Uncharacterized protein n=1 Tax=Ixodes ricinus TaxID=34613 RepID=A0A6B0UVS0_IXORI